MNIEKLKSTLTKPKSAKAPKESHGSGLIVPENAIGGADPVSSRRLGYLCRAGVVFLTVLGFALLISDSLDFEAWIAKSVMFSLIFTLLCALIGSSKVGAIIGVVGTGGALAMVLASSHEPIVAIEYTLRALTNSFYQKLDAIGYIGMNANVKSLDYALVRLGISPSELRTVALAAIVFALSALFSLCILRRVHLLPLLTVGCAALTVFLYYGMPETNTGFAVILSAVCGIAVLCGFDRIYVSKKLLKPDATGRSARREYRRAYKTNSALGGFAGLGTALLALIAVMLPSGIKQNMPEIRAISVPALKLENFLVSMVNGENPDLGSLLFSGVSSLDSRSTARDNPRYTGEQLFAIGLETELPVYLRSWVGTTYAGDRWYSPTYEEISEYKSRFGNDFSPEQMTIDLLRAFDPKLVELPETAAYRSHTDYGYVTSRVDVRKVRPTANLVHLPSYTDHRIGLLKYRERESTGVDYTTYSDGIFSSTSYLFLDDYSTVANLPLMRDPDFAKNLQALVTMLDWELNIVSSLSDRFADGLAYEDVESYYKGLRNIYGLPEHYKTEEDSLGYRYAFKMTSAERARIDDVIADRDEYDAYVRDVYLSECEGMDEIRSLAQSILSTVELERQQDLFHTSWFTPGMAQSYSTSNYGNRHALVMRIIEAMSETMYYTLAPAYPSENVEYHNAVVTFLTDTREGYCIHFASSAVMLLRSLGIPARYAEGYIANDFKRNPNHVKEVDEPRYTSPILDSDAHAWIEVYYDGYGWIQYEATAPYVSDMYVGRAPSQTPSEQPDPIEPLPEDTTTPIDVNVPTLPIEDDKEFPIAIVVALVIAAIITAVVLILRMRASRADSRALKLVREAGDTDSSDERIKYAKRLNERIFALLSIYGLTPHTGEQLPEFAARADSILGHLGSVNVSSIVPAIQASEFSTSVSAFHLSQTATCFSSLRSRVLEHPKLLVRLYRRYIMGV